MVLLSDPAAIRELYAASEHGLPPGRTAALRPIMGERSILLLEGAAHLERRRLMLPRVPRRTDALLRGGDRADHERGDRQVAARERIRAASEDARDHLRGDPRGGLRGHRRATGAAAARAASETARRHLVAGPQLPCAAREAPRPARPARGVRGARRARSTSCCSKRSGKAGFARGRGRPLAPAGRALRGRKRDERPGAARPAGDAAARRPRDDRDRARVDVRPADALARHAAAADRRARGGRRAMAARGDRRVAAIAAGPAAGGAPPRVGASHGGLHAAAREPTCRPRSG